MWTCLLSSQRSVDPSLASPPPPISRYLSATSHVIPSHAFLSSQHTDYCLNMNEILTRLDLSAAP
jgi:hypothetical protein